LSKSQAAVKTLREEEMERVIAVLLFAMAFGVVPAKAQSTETFEDSGGTCSTHTVSHNGGAAINWVCQAAIQSGSIEANSISFSVVLNQDGSFNNGYISFYDQTGQLAFVSTNFTGNYNSGNSPEYLAAPRRTEHSFPAKRASRLHRGWRSCGALSTPIIRLVMEAAT